MRRQAYRFSCRRIRGSSLYFVFPWAYAHGYMLLPHSRLSTETHVKLRLFALHKNNFVTQDKDAYQIGD